MATEIQIRNKAEELFKVFSEKRNSIRDDYCNRFEYLEDRLRDSWIAVATHVLNS